ncbi:hypothetical protein BDD43_1547 [Mucilaginibacter gracilis]|uniref:Outer membrane protein with beta-barrel domain n=1 Tax=Mucilaginibacter gracilis TaxID=423350 RepID=A0A495IYE4_9SPHI|nr:hypothetical protein [Mucilaginibacter gracilis]RKR81401.1 hypothetical protein BDD43_1547 [Mucilaginibacter gracilis]
MKPSGAKINKPNPPDGFINIKKNNTMKTTFKISALALAFAALSFGAKAQTTSTATTTTNSGIRLSIGVDAGVPVGNFSDAYNWNLGGSVQADIPVVKQLFVTVNAGYDNFFGKTVSGVSATNIQLIPVKAGLKYFLIDNLYIQGEAGASFLTNKSDFRGANSTLFTYAPQVGIQFPVSGKSFIDAGVRFEGNSALVDNGNKLNFIGLRLAYGFGL